MGLMENYFFSFYEQELVIHLDLELEVDSYKSFFISASVIFKLNYYRYHYANFNRLYFDLHFKYHLNNYFLYFI